MELDPNIVPEGWMLDSQSAPAEKQSDQLLSGADGCPPPAKKKRLCSSLKKGKEPTPPMPSTSRFASPVSEVQYLEAAKGVVPANTKKSNAWGERLFRAWVEERNKLLPLEPIPDDLLACHNSSTVSNKYLHFCILEVRAKDGKQYPTTTMCCTLNRIYKENTVMLRFRYLIKQILPLGSFILHLIKLLVICIARGSV